MKKIFNKILSLQWIKKIKDKGTFFYLFMFVLNIIGVLFIFVSRPIFGDDSVVVDAGTGKGSQQKIGLTSITLVSKSTNLKTGYGEILLKVEEPLTQVGIEYEVIVGENATRSLIPSKLTKIHDQYYLVQMDKIPKKWKQLVVDFGYTTSDKPKLNTNYNSDNLEEVLKEKNTKTEQVTYVLDYRKMKDSSDLVERTKDEYIVQVTDMEIRNIDELLQKASEDKESIRAEIQLLDDKVQTIESDKEFQTEEQIKDSDREIERLDAEIKKYATGITDIEKQETTLKDKKQKLIERNRKSQK